MRRWISASRPRSWPNAGTAARISSPAAVSGVSGVVNRVSMSGLHSGRDQSCIEKSFANNRIAAGRQRNGQPGLDPLLDLAYARWTFTMDTRLVTAGRIMASLAAVAAVTAGY